MTVVDPGPGAASPVAADRGWELVAPARRSGRHVLYPLAVGAITVAATVYTAQVNPNTSHAFPQCPLRYFTHLDCPMCGSLRAVHSLTHLDIVGAADHNLLLVLALPVVVIGYFVWLGRELGLDVPTIHISRKVVPWIVAIFVAYGVARNLPIPGHDFLNSTAHLAGRPS